MFQPDKLADLISRKAEPQAVLNTAAKKCPHTYSTHGSIGAVRELMDWGDISINGVGEWILEEYRRIAAQYQVAA